MRERSLIGLLFHRNIVHMIEIYLHTRAPTDFRIHVVIFQYSIDMIYIRIRMSLVKDTLSHIHKYKCTRSISNIAHWCGFFGR